MDGPRGKQGKPGNAGPAGMKGGKGAPGFAARPGLDGIKVSAAKKTILTVFERLLHLQDVALKKCAVLLICLFVTQGIFGDSGIPGIPGLQGPAGPPGVYDPLLGKASVQLCHSLRYKIKLF